MKHSAILSRSRRGKRYFYTNIGGKQYGLGYVLKDARKAFAKLMGDDGREDRFIRSPESGTTTILRGQLTKPAWLNTFPASMPRWRNW